MRLEIVLALIGAVGCSPSPTLQVSPAWPQGRVVVVVEREGKGDLPVRAHVFGPGKPVILPAPAGQAVGLTVFTYPPTDDPTIDPVTCGVSLDPDNPILVSPEAAFVAAQTDWSNGEAPTFEPVPDGMLSELSRPLGYADCVSDPYDCNRLTLETFSAEVPDGDIRALAVPNDDLVFYGSATGGVRERNQFDLYRGEAIGDPPMLRQTRVSSTGTTLTYRANSMAFDGTRVIGRTAGGESFSLDLDGTLTQGPRNLGYVAVATGAGMAFEMGAAGLRQIDGTNSSSISGVQTMALIAPDQLIATSSAGMLTWAGERWSLESGQFLGHQWRVSGDKDLAVAIHRDGSLLERVAPLSTWVDQKAPLGRYVDLAVILVLRGGRWMAAAQDSNLMVKLKTGRVCQLPTIAPNNYHIGAISPSGRTVWLGLGHLNSQSGDRSILVRIRLPEPAAN